MAGQVPDDRSLLDGIRLSFAEAALLCDALRALWLSPKYIERTWREMRDIIETQRLADALLAPLGRLRRSEATAVLRAAIRFWERHEEPTARLLNELGLIPRRQQRQARAIASKRKPKR